MDRLKKSRLVAQAAKGDTGAFSQLYGEIYKQLYYYALANLRNSEDAADAVQDAVLDAFAKISTLRKASAFDSWMFKILITKIRQKQKEYALRFGESKEVYYENAIIKEQTDFEQCEILDEFKKLSDNERLCITLSSIAGYKSEEIAKITGLKQSTVRSHISRGRAKLKRGLGV